MFCESLSATTTAHLISVKLAELVIFVGCWLWTAEEANEL